MLCEAFTLEKREKLKVNQTTKALMEISILTCSYFLLVQQ